MPYLHKIRNKSNYRNAYHYSPIKGNATRNYGANVVLAGEVYDDAYAEAVRLQRNMATPLYMPLMI